MDGGRVLRALLSGWLGPGPGDRDRRGRRPASRSSSGLYSLVYGRVACRCCSPAFIYFVAGVELAQVRQDEARRGGGTEDGVLDRAPRLPLGRSRATASGSSPRSMPTPRRDRRPWS